MAVAPECFCRWLSNGCSADLVWFAAVGAPESLLSGLLLKASSKSESMRSRSGLASVGCSCWEAPRATAMLWWLLLSAARLAWWGRESLIAGLVEMLRMTRKHSFQSKSPVLLLLLLLLSACQPGDSTASCVSIDTLKQTYRAGCCCPCALSHVQGPKRSNRKV